MADIITVLCLIAWLTPCLLYWFGLEMFRLGQLDGEARMLRIYEPFNRQRF